MKYPLPISSPYKPIITQYYGDKSRVDWYKANGIDIEAHNGLDLVLGDSVKTYGTRLVCPSPSAGLSKTWWENPMSTKGNGIEIVWSDESGYIQILCWHLSELVVKSKYSRENEIGFIGNSGLCSPKPTYQKPHDGAHLHLMAYRNGLIIDPLEIFDENNWFVAQDTGQGKDLPPLFWAFNYAKEQFNKLLKLIKK